MAQKLADQEVLGPNGMDRIAQLIQSIEPFVSVSAFAPNLSVPNFSLCVGNFLEEWPWDTLVASF